METASVPKPREPTPEPKGPALESDESSKEPAHEPTEPALESEEPSKEPAHKSTEPIPVPTSLYQQKPADIYNLLKIPHTEGSGY